MMDTSLAQPILAEKTAIHIQDNSGQIAIGNYIVQVGSVHGGVVNIAMPEQQPRPRLRPMPILLRPRRFPGLLDRSVETSMAVATLPAFQPVEFYGSSGWGKTSLLRHLAYHLPLASWPDGIVYLSAGQQPLADLLQFLFDAFYEYDVPFKPTAAQLRHALQRKQALILLDDLSLDQAELEAFMDVAPDSAFLLASTERRLWGEGRAVALQGLPLAEALMLLERELNRPLTSAEQEAAPALCAALKGHPLFLLQVGAMVRDQLCSLPEFSRQLEQDGPDKALVSQIIASLSGPEHQIMGLLAAMAGPPLHAEHLAALTGLPNSAPLLENLIQRKLIQAHSPRYSLTFTLNPAWTEPWDLPSLTEQILTYLVRWAEGHRQTPDRLLEEMESLRPMLAWAADNGRWPEVLRLGRAIEGALALAGRWGAWEQTLQQLLRAAEAVDNQAAVAWALHQLGSRSLCLEDFSAARTDLRQALRLREMLGDRAGATVTRHNLALLPPPPGTTGQEPTDTPPSSSQSTSGPILSPSLLELGASVFLIGGILTLLLLAMLIAPFLPQDWPATKTPLPAALPVVFVTITPALATIETPATTLTATFTPISPTNTATSTPSATATATASLTPTPTATPPAPSPEGVAACQPPPTWVVYIVQIGDTLDSLAVGTRTTVFELQQINCLESYTLQAGQILYLPFIPPTPTPTDTPTATPTRLSPSIISLSPSSGEEGEEVIILVEGQEFESDDPDFEVELVGGGGGALLTLGGLRTSTDFEAIVPPTLPVGSYDLFVINPDDQFTVKPDAYRVLPTIRPAPVVLLEPDRLDFGEQVVNTSSQVKTARLANIGAANLLLDTISLTGPQVDDFIIGYNCPASLAPASRCDLQIRFQPLAAGDRTANLTIFSNAADSPHIVLLSGAGQAQPDLVVTLLEITGPVFLGQNREPNLPVRAAIKNQGDAAAAVFKIAATYTSGNSDLQAVLTAGFKADSSDEVDPADGVYPFTRRELLAGEEVTFEGFLVFSPKEAGATVSLTVTADSCRDDRSLPPSCRVEELDENNNESGPISAELFNQID